MKTKQLILTAQNRELNSSSLTPRNGEFAIQLYSADLSANTDFNLQLSVDGIHWDIAQVGGENLVKTLTSTNAPLIQLDCVSNLKWKLVFLGATTGTVNVSAVAQ